MVHIVKFVGLMAFGYAASTAAIPLSSSSYGYTANGLTRRSPLPNPTTGGSSSSAPPPPPARPPVQRQPLQRKPSSNLKTKTTPPIPQPPSFLDMTDDNKASRPPPSRPVPQNPDLNRVMGGKAFENPRKAPTPDQQRQNQFDHWYENPRPAPAPPAAPRGGSSAPPPPSSQPNREQPKPQKKTLKGLFSSSKS